MFGESSGAEDTAAACKPSQASHVKQAKPRLAEPQIPPPFASSPSTPRCHRPATRAAATPFPPSSIRSDYYRSNAGPPSQPLQQQPRQPAPAPAPAPLACAGRRLPPSPSAIPEKNTRASGASNPRPGYAASVCFFLNAVVCDSDSSPTPTHPPTRPHTAAAGTSSANAEPASRAPDSSSTDRQGFFKSLGITASAALLGTRLEKKGGRAPSTLFTTPSTHTNTRTRTHGAHHPTNTGPALLQRQAPIIPAAQAIGGLPEFEADARFAQHLVVNVPDMEAAVDFYTKGLSFQASRSFLINLSWGLFSQLLFFFLIKLPLSIVVRTTTSSHKTKPSHRLVFFLPPFQQNTHTPGPPQPQGERPQQHLRRVRARDAPAGQPRRGVLPRRLVF